MKKHVKRFANHVHTHEKHIRFAALAIVAIILLGVGMPLIIFAAVDAVTPAPSVQPVQLITQSPGNNEGPRPPMPPGQGEGMRGPNNGDQNQQRPMQGGPNNDQQGQNNSGSNQNGQQNGPNNGFNNQQQNKNQGGPQKDQNNNPNGQQQNQNSNQGDPNQQSNSGPSQGGSQNGSKSSPQQQNNGEQNQGQNNAEQQRQEKQQLKMVQQNMQGISSHITALERQVQRMQKSGIVIPNDITDALTKTKSIISAVKSATSIEDAQTAGLDDLQDFMQTLDEGQQTLQQLVQWQQTVKQMDRTLTQLKTQLKRDQATATRLAKTGGLDISSQVTEFADAITKLQSVRDQANTLVTTDAEQASSLAQDSFFGTLDTVMQSDQVINYLAHLGNFSRTFKTLTTQMDKKIAQLKKSGQDTATVEQDLVELKDAGAAVLTAIQAKPMDADTLMGTFDTLSSAQQQLQGDLEDLIGGTQPSSPPSSNTQPFNFQPFSTNVMPQGPVQTSPVGGGQQRF